MVCLLALALVPAGCGDSRATGVKLAAKVNGTEISAQQVASLGSAGKAATSRQALDKVIDRELLVQKALQAKLDSDPLVIESIAAARREVLAQAYLERSGASLAKASSEEVSAFYAENPALFAQRRVYRIREMTVSAGTDKLDLLRAEVANAKDLEEVAGWLKWRNLKVSVATTATQSAEQLPLAYLPQLARMKEGEIAVLPSALGASVVQLVQAQEAPLTEQQAAPLIGQFLDGRKKLELAAAEVKRLRAAATIEYVGDFKR
jgi:EpsD family peptidyl-prolyl cis-trans isomerase